MKKRYIMNILNNVSEKNGVNFYKEIETSAISVTLVTFGQQKSKRKIFGTSMTLMKNPKNLFINGNNRS